MVRSQLQFDWTAAPAPPAGTGYRDLKAFVQRVRLAGVEALRTLKRLVDAAIEEDSLVITDDDIPF